MYGPQYFIDEDVVIVTINYRLASLGNLYLYKSAFYSIINVN